MGLFEYLLLQKVTAIEKILSNEDRWNQTPLAA